jgi:predicted nucleic acid-binding protein
MNMPKSYVGSKRMEELMPMIREIMDAGIKRADATHIACAIDSGCDYLITTDDRMLKYKDNRTTIITPNDMLYIMEGLR